jgi:N-acetylglutamate synthase-like GNAT family acetyltransferase
LSISIEQIQFSDLIPIKEKIELAKMKLINTNNTIWLGAKINGKLVGITAYSQKKDVILFKSSFVLKEYRRQGIYKLLFEESMKQATLLRPRKIKAYCTKMSVQHFLNNGFEVVNQKKGITEVNKIMLKKWRNRSEQNNAQKMEEPK